MINFFRVGARHLSQGGCMQQIIFQLKQIDKQKKKRLITFQIFRLTLIFFPKLLATAIVGGGGCHNLLPIASALPIFRYVLDCLKSKF